MPVLLYYGVRRADDASEATEDDSRIDAEAFARQMLLLDHAGYETIALDEFVRFVRGEKVSLPSRPLLLTFDTARAETWIATDASMRKLGVTATVFVDVDRVGKDPDYLTWGELRRLQRSGRWEPQLRSGTGYNRIRYGPEADDVGAFYAYRGAEERIDGWRERVFSDITWGEEQLAFRLRGYRPLAFAPPDGNYGQAGTNDRRIPRLLLARLFLSFDVVFARDRSGVATPGGDGREPIGRIELTPGVTERDLHALLTAPQR